MVQQRAQSSAAQAQAQAFKTASDDATTSEYDSEDNSQEEQKTSDGQISHVSAPSMDVRDQSEPSSQNAYGREYLNSEEYFQLL